MNNEEKIEVLDEEETKKDNKKPVQRELHKLDEFADPSFARVQMIEENEENGNEPEHKSLFGLFNRKK